jgi:hypothetical protein
MKKWNVKTNSCIVIRIVSWNKYRDTYRHDKLCIVPALTAWLPHNAYLSYWRLSSEQYWTFARWADFYSLQLTFHSTRMFKCPSQPISQKSIRNFHKFCQLIWGFSFQRFSYCFLWMCLWQICFVCCQRGVFAIFNSLHWRYNWTIMEMF